MTMTTIMVWLLDRTKKPKQDKDNPSRSDAPTLGRSHAPTLLSNTPLLHHSITPSPVFSVTDREEITASTELGAAQKDTARELTAKLASLKGIIWVGLATFLFGLGSLCWPPLQALIGSLTTSAAITVGGLALMILPTLVAGHELLILGAVVLLVAAWFLAHRHGHLRGQLAAALSPNQKSKPNPKKSSLATGS